MITNETIHVLFQGFERLGHGSLEELAILCLESCKLDGARISFYEDETGGVVDVDLSGTEAEVVARIREPETVKVEATTARPRKPGRPKLGVVSREVSLLPRHWSWLSDQGAGASATLRKLVDQAKKNESADSIRRRGIDAAHKFLWDIGGDLPNFEELSRALYACKLDEVRTQYADWPSGIIKQLERYLERL